MASESCVYIFSLEHFVVLKESSWGCMSYQLLNHEQLLPIPVSSDTMPFQRYIFLIDLPNLFRICYIALSRSFGRIAFEFHDIVHIFHTLFQKAMLTPTKLTQCLEELNYQFRQFVWILNLTMILYLCYSIWFERSVSF